MASRKRELLLLRHGIAEERLEGVDDAKRSLTPVGRVRTAKQLQRLFELDLTCDLVLSSPLVRARQTAELVVDAGLAPELEIAAALAPLADPLPLLERWLGPLSPRPGWRRLALVGHEPDLSTLAALLIGVPMAKAPEALHLKKAGVVLLQWPASGPSGELLGSARLELVLPPRILLGPRQRLSETGLAEKAQEGN
jgi:phosphohistidine phosphatase